MDPVAFTFVRRPLLGISHAKHFCKKDEIIFFAPKRNCEMLNSCPVIKAVHIGNLVVN